jgi:hypothetical protein
LIAGLSVVARASDLALPGPNSPREDRTVGWLDSPLDEHTVESISGLDR